MATQSTEELIILPVRDMVLFPGVVLPVAANRPRNKPVLHRQEA